MTRTQLLAVMVWIGLCVSCSNLDPAKGTNTSTIPKERRATHLYEGAYDKVWAAAVGIMKRLESERLLIREEDKAHGYIEAQKGVGEEVTLRIKPVDSARCQVEIVGEAFAQPTIWTRLIHNELGRVLPRADQ